MAICRFKKFIFRGSNHESCLFGKKTKKIKNKNLNLSRQALQNKHVSCPAPLPNDALPTLNIFKEKGVCRGVTISYQLNA